MSDKIKGITDLPPFLGVVCLKCERPFLIWKTEFEGITPDDPSFSNYMTEGHKVKVIASEVVRDIDLWCACRPLPE